MTTKDPASARLMVRRLSDLLRAVLVDAGKETVPLHRELELLDAYVEIQRVRFGNRLRWQALASDQAALVDVPALILQPLVENAIQYAVAEREGGGEVALDARLDGDCLVLTISDDGPGCSDPQRAAPDDAGTGLGHRNARARLLHLYGKRCRFVLETSASGGCQVRIELPAMRGGGPHA